MVWTAGIILLVVIAGTVRSDTNELDLDDLEKRLQEIPGLEDRDAIPGVEDVDKIVKEKCEKNGGEEAYNNLQEQKSYLQECLQSNINVTVAQAELEEAKKTGSMDEVFGKYCKKVPEIMYCIKNVTEAAKPCFEDKEKESLKIGLNITESLINFMCYKDGDRIAMFVAEGGIQCLEERKDGLQTCLNKTVASNVPADLNVNSLPLLLFEAQECKSFDELQTCAVSELEKCKDNTPANIMDAVFKFVRRISPCNTFKKSVDPVTSEYTSNGRTLYGSFLSVLTVLLLVLYT